MPAQGIYVMGEAANPAAPPGPASGLGPGAQLYRIPHVMRLLRMSRSVVCEPIPPGRLRSVREGQPRLIPASAVAEYVALLESEARR